MKQWNNNPGDFGAWGTKVANAYKNFTSTNANYPISIDSVLSSAMLYIFKMKHKKWLRIQTDIGCKNIRSPRCSRKRCFLRLPAYLGTTTINRESIAKKKKKKRHFRISVILTFPHLPQFVLFPFIFPEVNAQSTICRHTSESLGKK